MSDVELTPGLTPGLTPASSITAPTPPSPTTPTASPTPAPPPISMWPGIAVAALFVGLWIGLVGLLFVWPLVRSNARTRAQTPQPAVTSPAGQEVAR